MIASCDGDFEQHPYVSVSGKEVKTGPVENRACGSDRRVIREYAL
jgi:hypothetical protein